MRTSLPALPGVIGEALDRARVARRGRRRRSGQCRRRGLPVPVAVAAGRAATALSRGTGLGHGSMIAGRVALFARPDVLPRLVRKRTSIVITGTNGKTTTSHLTVAALAGRGQVAHNASGSNMPDGWVAAMIESPRARLAVLEADELHLEAAMDALQPSPRPPPPAPGNDVIANADDPLVVWAAGAARSVVWVAAGTCWHCDSDACPACGGRLARRTGPHDGHDWHCPGCGLARPAPAWWWNAGADGATAHRRHAAPVPLDLSLPGRVNLGNATMALAAVHEIGTDALGAAPRLRELREVWGVTHSARTGVGASGFC